jgi:hypothetical protein
VDENTLLCGMTWYNIFQTTPSGDAWYNLAHQWIAAKLNLANFASVPVNVQDALDQAEVLLTGNCASLGQSQSAQAGSLTDILNQYNTGRLGPGHCTEGVTTAVTFPNPATGDQVTLQMPDFEGQQDTLVQIFTTSFRKVKELSFSQILGSTQVTISLLDRSNIYLANGLYYVRISTPATGGQWIVRLLVLR